jgi:hypothetical protein
VTVRVVDALEAVDVDHGEGGGLAVAGAALDLALEVVFEAAPVREPGEGLLLGLQAQLLLERPALGDVLDLADEVQRSPGLVGRERDRQVIGAAALRLKRGVSRTVAA